MSRRRRRRRRTRSRARSRYVSNSSLRRVSGNSRETLRFPGPGGLCIRRVCKSCNIVISLRTCRRPNRRKSCKSSPTRASWRISSSALVCPCSNNRSTIFVIEFGRRRRSRELISSLDHQSVVKPPHLPLPAHLRLFRQLHCQPPRRSFL